MGAILPQKGAGVHTKRAPQFVIATSDYPDHFHTRPHDPQYLRWRNRHNRGPACSKPNVDSEATHALLPDIARPLVSESTRRRADVDVHWTYVN